MFNFVPKLNRSDEPYVIEDEVLYIHNGKGEGFLKHDNVIDESIEIWTQPKRQGEKINTYVIEKTKRENWKTYLIVYANVDCVYVTYLSYGDRVEAEDVNELQNAINDVSNVLESHINNKDVHIVDGIIDCGSF